jgi:hypothetical protein
MQRTVADDLMDSSGVNFESQSEWPRTQQFEYDALMAVRADLDPAVRAALEVRGASAPALAESVSAREAIWNICGSDSMGQTPSGAAARAALFAFAQPESPQEQPGEWVWYFSMFYTRAGFSEESLRAAFHRHWPKMTPNTSLERTREG